MKKIFLISALLFSITVFAGPSIESYKKELLSNLQNAPTETLIITRALNNAYIKFCQNMGGKEHKFYSEVVSPIITKEIALNSMNRDDWGLKGDMKYGFQKGKLISWHKKQGERAFCDCVYENVVNGKQCFN